MESTWEGWHAFHFWEGIFRDRMEVLIGRRISEFLGRFGVRYHDMGWELEMILGRDGDQIVE